ncbi:MAG: NADH:ubiquinone reductase (Na(+)-transporting) subunit F, partial [Rubricella sp.]
MTEVVLATLVMTAIVIALSLVVMGARKVLVPDVAVTVRLGDGREIAARAGDKLLPVLKDAGLPIPSACAGA